MKVTYRLIGTARPMLRSWVAMESDYFYTRKLYFYVPSRYETHSRTCDVGYNEVVAFAGKSCQVRAQRMPNDINIWHVETAIYEQPYALSE